MSVTDRNQLISLMRQSAALNLKRTRFCPKDEEIAAFVDGMPSGGRRDSLERHLPDCPTCVQRVGLLTRLLREPVAHPKTVPARAKTVITEPTHRWAAAAMVLLAVGLLTWSPVKETSEFRSTRATQSVLTQPKIVAPRAGTLARRDGLVVRWTEVPGSIYYEVRIVSDDGALISLQRVDEPNWHFEDSVDLRPGHEYYVRVDAFLADSKAIRSEHVPFHVRD